MVRRLSRADVRLMERLMLNKQKKVKDFLTGALLSYYDKENLIIRDDFLAAKGTIPIAVAAHMDTVWETSVGHEVFYDEYKNTMVNLRGGGYDDKAGIFMILKLLENGYRPHVIFCTNEEIGSLGADAFVKEFPDCPFEDCRFIIMLDRRGHNDCVFYDCDNEEFEKYCESFGFETAWGSFTDICTLCPAWGMAGVNFSVGYFDEHTANEKLCVGYMFETLQKVETILSQPTENIPRFNYIPSIYSWKPYYPHNEYHDEYGGICWGCGKDLNKVPASRKTQFYDNDGYLISFCEECAPKYINYCAICGSAFEIDPSDQDEYLCPECRSELMTRKNLIKE